MAYAAAYLAAALVMGLLDYLWLSNTVGPLYHRALGAVIPVSAILRSRSR